MELFKFLPVSKEDMISRGWYWYDFLVVTGDAYVDHPSFGPTVIARLLESEGYRVAILAQPDWHSAEAFAAMGKPRFGVFIGAGNLDSMVAHYTAAKKRRSEDFYSPGKMAGLRPDRATIVYANRAREAFGDIPVIIGGLEASLRRFAHYDYWEDKVRRSIIFDSKADLLVYGMGEYATKEIAKRLKKKIHPSEIKEVKGTAFIGNDPSECVYESITVASYEEVTENKWSYAEATRHEYEEHDPVRGKALIQAHGDRYLIVNPPAMPLTTEELDKVAELPYTKDVHPMYDDAGGVPAIEEVRFSIIHNRGCFGACNFCALAFHQGRMITSRSHESVIREVTALTKHPEWKGYINDVGGPTANFRRPSCQQQLTNGMCRGKKCLAPTPCKNLDADHSDYLSLLRKLREIPGVKKIFVRSGIRFDYMLCDKNGEFFAELVNHHVSGQLKVAPEHCVDGVLDYMGKPHIETYEQFLDKYKRLNQRYGKEQYTVPYLMSSHPGSTLNDAVDLAVYLNRAGRQPEQVQDFYPTPGTISTCMYYTDIDPMTMKPVYVPKTFHEKALQRALLQWKRPDKRRLVLEALKEAGREDLIGFGKEHLVRPDSGYRKPQSPKKNNENDSEKPKTAKKAGESSGGKPQQADSRTGNKGSEKPQYKDKKFADNAKPQSKDKKFGDNVKPQGKDKKFADNVKPQGKDKKFADNVKPQGKDKKFADNAKPQGKDKKFADNAKPQGKDKKFGDNVKPQGKDKKFADNAKPQGKDKKFSDNVKPQSKDKKFADNSKPQGKDKKFADNSKPQKNYKTPEKPFQKGKHK